MKHFEIFIYKQT